MRKNFPILLMMGNLIFSFLTGCCSHDFSKNPVPKQVELIPLPEIKIYTLSTCKQIAVQRNIEFAIYCQKKLINDVKVTAKVLEKIRKFADCNPVATYPVSKESKSSINYILDFTMALLNSSKKNRYDEFESAQRRRMVQNINYRVTEKYMHVVSLQNIIAQIEKSLPEYERTNKLIKQLVIAEKVSPLCILQQMKFIIRIKKKLKVYRQRYHKAVKELCAQMSYLPDSSIKVDVECFNQLNFSDIPNIENLIKIAIIERTELKHLNINTANIFKETYQVILKMFPQKKFFMYSKQYNSFLNNKFYWNNPNWSKKFYWALAIHAANNLLKTAQRIYNGSGIMDKEDELSLRKLSLIVGVITQTKIIYTDFKEKLKRYQQDIKTHQIYKKYFEKKRDMKVHKMIHVLEVKRLRSDTDECFIKLIDSREELWIAYNRLLNTLGVESLNSAAVKVFNAKIKQAEMGKDLRVFTQKAIKKYIKTDKQLYGLPVNRFFQ